MPRAHDDLIRRAHKVLNATPENEAQMLGNLCQAFDLLQEAIAALEDMNGRGRVGSTFDSWLESEGMDDLIKQKD